MTVAGCELRRGDDGTMRVRDKESSRTCASLSCSLLPYNHPISPFSLLLLFFRLSAYAIIAFIRGKANSEMNGDYLLGSVFAERRYIGKKDRSRV